MKNEHGKEIVQITGEAAPVELHPEVEETGVQAVHEQTDVNRAVSQIQQTGVVAKPTKEATPPSFYPQVEIQFNKSKANFKKAGTGTLPFLTRFVGDTSKIFWDRVRLSREEDKKRAA